jgi:hypothetical protein
MSAIARYDASVAFLRNLDDDWAGLVAHVGPCLHDPKAAREPYEALVRAIGYQQLTAKAGDAIIARLKALYPDTTFPTPETIMVAEFDALRACGFSATKVATIKAIAEGALSGLIPPHNVAGTMDDEELIARVVTIKGIGRWTVEMLLSIRWSAWTSCRPTISGCAKGIGRSSPYRNSPSRTHCARSGKPGRRIAPLPHGIFGACPASAAMSSNERTWT